MYLKFDVKRFEKSLLPMQRRKYDGPFKKVRFKIFCALSLTSKFRDG